MEIDLNKTLRALVRCLPEDGEPNVEDLTRMYRQTLRLRSQLLGVIYDLEAYFVSRPGQQELAETMSSGGQEDGCVVLTFEESLPSMKEYSAALDEHWRAMIHAAIQEAAAQERLPRFERAFVQIDVTTPRGSNNRQLWDTCNRAVNLVINNLKGIFFWDDDLEHMAFSVVGAWGEIGRTVVRISRFLGALTHPKLR